MIPAYFAPTDSAGGLLNWLFGGGIGTNLGASLIWAALAFVVGVVMYPPSRRWIMHHLSMLHNHNEWQARQTQKIMQHLGLEMDKHPHYDLDGKS